MTFFKCFLFLYLTSFLVVSNVHSVERENKCAVYETVSFWNESLARGSENFIGSLFFDVGKGPSLEILTGVFENKQQIVGVVVGAMSGAVFAPGAAALIISKIISSVTTLQDQKQKQKDYKELQHIFELAFAKNFKEKVLLEVRVRDPKTERTSDVKKMLKNPLNALYQKLSDRSFGPLGYSKEKLGDYLIALSDNGKICENSGIEDKEFIYMFTKENLIDLIEYIRDDKISIEKIVRISEIKTQKKLGAALDISNDDESSIASVGFLNKVIAAPIVATKDEVNGLGDSDEVDEFEAFGETLF